jgi:hypothetical protein
VYLKKTFVVCAWLWVGRVKEMKITFSATVSRFFVFRFLKTREEVEFSSS